MLSRDTRPEPEDPRPFPPARDRESEGINLEKEVIFQRTRLLVINALTCPSTGEGEEPVVMVAGVKAERCRSWAEGTLSEGF